MNYIDVMKHVTICRWKCDDCGGWFDEPEIDIKRMHYVVGDMDKYRYEEREVCPECGSTEIHEEYLEIEED